MGAGLSGSGHIGELAAKTGLSLEEMTDLLGIIDTLQAAAPGSDTLEVRSRLNRFIDQAVERRQTLERQLEMADESLALLRRQ